MGGLKQIGRVFVNVTCFRGRRRPARVLGLLLLSAVALLLTKYGVCTVYPSVCETAGSDSAFEKLQNAFEDGPAMGLVLDDIKNKPAMDHELPLHHRSIKGSQQGEDAKPGGAPRLKIPRSIKDDATSDEHPQGYADEKGGVEEDYESLEQHAAQVKAPEHSVQQQPLEGGSPGPSEQEDGETPSEGVNALSKEDFLKQQRELAEQMKQGKADAVAKRKQEALSDAVVAGGKEEQPGKQPSDQEQRRMTAEQVAEAIRNGDMCKKVCPPFVWSDWSPCSKACGHGRKYRKAIYEFVCQSSELCPPNRIEESSCEIPCMFDPEKYGGPGGLEMYPINPLNPPMYPEDKEYSCGHWLVEYEKIHNDIVLGRRPPAYLLYSTGKGDYPTAGGLAARIRGITTVFFMAVLLERAFLIEWLDPPSLSDYLEPKSFDWADLSPIRELKRGPVRDIGSWRSAKESGKSAQWYMNSNLTEFFVNPVEVVQGHRYDFTFAVLRNPGLMPKAYELGVDGIKCRICCAWDMLFKMTYNFEKEMGELLKSVGHPNRPLTTIQMRSKSDDVQASVKTAEHYIKCAVKAGKDLKLSNTIWVPVFNSRLVVHIIAKKYTQMMRTPIQIDSATRTVHTHFGNLPPDTELAVAKGVQERTFKEFFLMLNSTVLVRTKGYVGSFGNVADAIRRFYAPIGSVYTYTPGGNTCVLFPDYHKIE